MGKENDIPNHGDRMEPRGLRSDEMWVKIPLRTLRVHSDLNSNQTPHQSMSLTEMGGQNCVYTVALHI